jgi:hypothetical protein
VRDVNAPPREHRGSNLVLRFPRRIDPPTEPGFISAFGVSPPSPPNFVVLRRGRLLIAAPNLLAQRARY